MLCNKCLLSYYFLKVFISWRDIHNKNKRNERPLQIIRKNILGKYH